jgi:hypothetical protein
MPSPKISHPCPQDWNAMAGDDKRRFCEHCQLYVHNLSALSSAEQCAFFSTTETRKCVRYLASAETSKPRLQRLWPAALALLAMLLPFLSSGCASDGCNYLPPPSSTTHDCKQTRELSSGKILMGAIEEPRPIWRRIIFFWES